MIIKELWIPKINDDLDENAFEYISCSVISMGKKTAYADGKPVSELLSALVFNPDNGQIDEVFLIDSFIKEMQDDKTKEYIRFDYPRE